MQRNNNLTNNKSNSQNSKDNSKNDTFQWQIDQFADIRIMRYQIPGWETLTVKQKKLLYYLSEAALCGRDILFDQNYKHNLAIRRTLESIYKGYTGNRNTEQWQKFMVYLKRVWFSNGIHHHASTDKFLPNFSQDYFTDLVKKTPAKHFPKELGSQEEILKILPPIMFNADIAAKRVNQDSSIDIVTNSANNYYEGVTQNEAEEFYAKAASSNNENPVSLGLNSKLLKSDEEVTEKIWKLNGMYSAAIEKIIVWLEKASEATENEHQRNVIESLLQFYKTGDLKEFNNYSVLWVNDLNSRVDFINGFIENYGDPMGYKGSWESLVNFTDIEATKRTTLLSENAQWFEDNSPIESQFKKSNVKGVSAKVINVVAAGGDCYPAIPLGINLPNADWIRAQHGSKSVTLENIAYAHHRASVGNGFIEEFAWDEQEVSLHQKYGFMANNLHTDLHECLGHGSGQLAREITGDELKQYGSPIEEARADLFALYFIMDPQLVKLGVIPSLDVAKAEYNNYIRNGMLTQLTRVMLGKNLEQAHMRNRQLVASWCYEQGKANKVIEKKHREGKTYFVINDYEKLRDLFGQLLRRIQHIKSTGNYSEAQMLVENYGVTINKELHAEVLERFAKLKIAPYGGFVNPKLIPTYKNNEIVDVTLDYSENYIDQMVRYSKEYSYLPTYN
ncbi:MAG: dipeptidyl-peptidase 3 family protein [Bacteroidales bacterium]